MTQVKPRSMAFVPYHGSRRIRVGLCARRAAAALHPGRDPRKRGVRPETQASRSAGNPVRISGAQRTRLESVRFTPRYAEAVALAVGCVIGCKDADRSALPLRDSEGRLFDALCDGEGRCELSQKQGTKWSGDKTAHVIRTSGRVVGVCNIAPGGEVESPGDCRALVCKSDNDCPPVGGLGTASCLSQFCTDLSRDLSPSDAAMLCLAGTGLGRDTTSQVERLALGLNCGSPCKVPLPCRQL